MDKKIAKGIILLAFVIAICVVLAKVIGNSESVADYADAHGQEWQERVAPTVEPIPTEEAKPTRDVSPTENVAEPIATETVSVDEDMTEADEQEDDRPIESTEDSFYIEEISDELREYMRGKSYADDIDESIVNFDMLRHVVILYNDFDGNTVKGDLVCSELIAQDLLDIFKELYESGYQLEEVSLIDKYDADDDASMEANNTSCFNYRLVDRSTKLSYHAYGLAIDVNPFYNPYVEYKAEGDDYICPTQSAPYAYRDSEFPYKIDKNDLAYKLFTAHGFKWGGNWNSCKDYQHFEKRLR